jgi:LasA protease
MSMKSSRASLALLLCMALSGCLAQGGSLGEAASPGEEPEPTAASAPLPSRAPIQPGELVDYVVQSGDSLAALAAHFNTTVDEILAANPQVPAEASTLAPGYPLRIPAYYVPLTGSTFQILPDSEVILGPSTIGFDVRQDLARRSGFVTQLTSFAYRKTRTAWETVDVVARMYSLNPRLLLALLEHQTQALSRPFAEGNDETYVLGYEDRRYRGFFRQLMWAAERLCDGYYGWRDGTLTEFELADGLLQRPDPWQNAGTVAIQYLFAEMYGFQEFNQVVGPEGFYRTYEKLWGDPFALEIELIPPDLRQPDLVLPFMPNHTWSYTGGPHSAWGTALPYGALDFAPPATVSGCEPSTLWVVAPAAGVVARAEEAFVMLDLDGDGDERTGWVIFFYHMATEGLVREGTHVEVGDLLGHPSCEGGRATGTHFHIARRYNGEWIAADGPVPFVLSGWRAVAGEEPYEGYMVQGTRTIEACACSNPENAVRREGD